MIINRIIKQFDKGSIISNIILNKFALESFINQIVSNVQRNVPETEYNDKARYSFSNIPPITRDKILHIMMTILKKKIYLLFP